MQERLRELWMADQRRRRLQAEAADLRAAIDRLEPEVRAAAEVFSRSGDLETTAPGGVFGWRTEPTEEAQASAREVAVARGRAMELGGELQGLQAELDAVGRGIPRTNAGKRRSSDAIATQESLDGVPEPAPNTRIRGRSAGTGPLGRQEIRDLGDTRAGLARAHRDGMSDPAIFAVLEADARAAVAAEGRTELQKASRAALALTLALCGVMMAMRRKPVVHPDPGERRGMELRSWSHARQEAATLLEALARVERRWTVVGLDAVGVEAVRVDLERLRVEMAEPVIRPDWMHMRAVFQHMFWGRWAAEAREIHALYDRLEREAREIQAALVPLLASATDLAASAAAESAALSDQLDRELSSPG